MYRVFITICSFIVLSCFTSCNNNDYEHLIEYHRQRIESLESANLELARRVSEVERQLNVIKSAQKIDSKFESEIKCQELFDRLKNRWNNVIGCYYSTRYNTCMVKYLDNGKVKESKVEDMQDSRY